jgi:ribose transport system ATP-binding protein
VEGRVTGSTSPAEAAPHALVARGLSKAFAGVPALRAVDLSIASGEVHALLGENGSGKSTFIKILSGYHQPDGGEVSIAGSPVSLGSPDAAYAAGCRFVHQDLGLVESESVLDNLYLNAGFPTRAGTIRTRDARSRAREELAKVGLGDLDPRTPVAALTPAVKTGVAVARALLRDEHVEARLLVLDEPTATLPDNEVQHLLEIVRAVARTGVGILYVTHRLDEVFEVADNVTVLRDGAREAVEKVADLDRRRLVNLLVGSEFDEIHAVAEARGTERGEPVLRVRGLEAGPLRGVDLDACAGDVIGIAGITGSGRETVLGSLFGATSREAGTVEVAGKPVPVLRPHVAMRLGMAYLPPDRKRHGGLMELSARENISLAHLAPFWNRVRLHRGREVAEAKRWFERLGVRPSAGHDRVLSTFSGGNQQKVLFGKWLRRTPTVFLLDEPTQGVDVGAKAELHRQLLNAANDGAAVLVSSSDVDELAALCQRVVVLRDGVVVADLSGAAVSLATITRECLGANRKVVAS